MIVTEAAAKHLQDRNIAVYAFEDGQVVLFEAAPEKVRWRTFLRSLVAAIRGGKAMDPAALVG